MKDKVVLDACAGSKKFWFDKENEHTVYMDIREGEETLCDGRKLTVSPDVVGDFRNMPFEDGSFKLVVFDPPPPKRFGEKFLDGHNLWEPIAELGARHKKRLRRMLQGLGRLRHIDI